MSTKSYPMVEYFHNRAAMADHTPGWADLSGRRALTIGASRGLGRECALALAAAGAHVCCAARSRPALDRVVADVAARGGRATALVLDAGVEAELIAGVAAAVGDGPLDVLVY